MEDVKELEKEIEILKERISNLEKKENHRKGLAYAKAVVKILAILLLALGIWKGYNYLTEYLPTYLNDQVKNLIPSNLLP